MTDMKEDNKYTIKQIYDKGIAAHRDGHVNAAKRFYSNVLMHESSHPGANHHLGTIPLPENEDTMALSLFKNVISALPSEEKFWESYILALIEKNQVKRLRLS